MPQASQPAAKTDTTSNAQGRFTVSLPADVGKGIDDIGAKLADAMFTTAGVRLELTRAQIVQSLVKTALQVQAEQGE